MSPAPALFLSARIVIGWRREGKNAAAAASNLACVFFFLGFLQQQQQHCFCLFSLRVTAQHSTAQHSHNAFFFFLP